MLPKPECNERRQLEEPIQRREQLLNAVEETEHDQKEEDSANIHKVLQAGDV